MPEPFKGGRPLTQGEVATERLGLTFKPTEFERLDSLRGDVPRATYLKLLLQQAAESAAPDDEDPDAPTVPLLGYISAGEGLEIRQMPEGSTVTPPFTVPPDAYALFVVGDSMERPNGRGSIPDGSVAIFLPMNICPPGSIVHAEFESDDKTKRLATIKRLNFTGEGAGLLEPLNPKSKEPLPMHGFEVKGVFLRAIPPVVKQ